MTYGEIRAMLRRVNARQLRAESGISVRTVARALSLPVNYAYDWESGRRTPTSPAGLRWAKVIAGLERHAAVTAEIAAAEERAA